MKERLKNIIDERVRIANQVFILPHVHVDADALASSICMSLIVNKLHKKDYILLNLHNIEFSSNDSILYIKRKFQDKVLFITKDDYDKLKSDKDQVIIVDFNKEHLMPYHNLDFSRRNVVVIDHHLYGQDIIPTQYKYINPTESSTCEIMLDLLNMYKIEISHDLASILLSGIYLDSFENPKRVNVKTYATIAELLIKGAKFEEVKKWFKPNRESEDKIDYLVSGKRLVDNRVSISTGKDNIIYTKAELAKAATRLLNITRDASFVFGFIDKDELQVSARSKGGINVAHIMEQMGGGGTKTCAASTISTNNMEENVKKLVKIIKK